MFFSPVKVISEMRLFIIRIRRLILNCMEWKSFMKQGDLVAFCKNPPAEPEHCNIWSWGVGIFVEKEENLCHILCEGKIYVVEDIWVSDSDDLWFPGGVFPS